ncbi:MAG: thymidine phosphorylase [Anaerolineales bacterium]|nr:MAG: thymidine phosphorylase [Anaerolineales bacterium]
MRAVDIIIKKRDKHELTQQEIDFFVKGYTRDEIPDYQAAAWTMAVLLNGMSARETTDLTLAIARSGETLDLSTVVPVAVDKHSTGGVGDKTTLVVEPVVAACGLPVGKMSGRGLGFTGGTLDKLESIPGYRVNLTTDEFLEQLRTIGLVLTGQTADLAPADGKFYALRDVTGTIPSIPLIASSVMSKKIAAGAQALVLDVKVGLGAFMPDVSKASELSELMVTIGKQADRKAVALLSDMNQPLGQAVGNALELKEAIATLRGGGPADFREHSLVVAGHLLALGGLCEDEEKGKHMAAAVLEDGRGWEKFIALVRAQGGEVSAVENPNQLPEAELVKTDPAPRSGYLAGVHARRIGEIAVQLGAGRAKKGDPIDHAVGIQVHHNVGDEIEAGEALFTIHANDRSKLEQARQELLAAHTWSDKPVDPLPLFYGVVR